MELTPDHPEFHKALTVLIEDPSPPVREAAIKRCDDLATLRSVRQEDPDASVRTAATVRYRQRLLGDEPPERVAAELARCEDPTLVAHVAQQGRTATLRRIAIDALEQTTVLIEVALHDDDPDTRLYAVERLQDPAALEQLAERARTLAPEVAAAAERRHHGGTAAAPPQTPPSQPAATEPERHEPAPSPPSPEAPAPSPTSAEAMAQAAHTHPRAERLCRVMEALADGGWWPGFHARRRALLDQWRSLDPPPPEPLAFRFREATVAALMQQPKNHGGEATRARLELEGLLEAACAAEEDPASAISQRLEAFTRSLGELSGDHPDEARARICLQRLGRLVPQVRPLRAHHAGRQPPAPRRRFTIALNRALEAAEQAVSAGALREARRHLQAARRALDQEE